MGLEPGWIAASQVDVLRTLIVLTAATMAGCVSGGINRPGMVPGGTPPLYGMTVTVNDFDRAPIAGATVVVDVRAFPLTDRDGITAARVPLGWHTLKVSAPGYCPQLWGVDVADELRVGVALDKQPCEKGGAL